MASLSLDLQRASHRITSHQHATPIALCSRHGYVGLVQHCSQGSKKENKAEKESGNIWSFFQFVGKLNGQSLGSNFRNETQRKTGSALPLAQALYSLAYTKNTHLDTPLPWILVADTVEMWCK